jgi:hypothetical protein
MADNAPAREQAARRLKPATPVAWLERGAAVIGAVVVLAGGWNWLMAAPAISLSGPDVADVLAGEAPNLELTVVNDAETKSRVTLSSATPGDVLDPNAMALEPGQRVTVRLRGQAATVGDRSIEVSASASAGWFRRTAHATHRFLRRDWPAIATSEPVSVLKVDGPRSARLRSTIGTGAAQATGLRCLAVARLPASATFAGVSPAETLGNPMRNREHANEAVSLIWLTRPTRAFESMPHTFYLESEDDWDPARWDALASRTSITCERR